MASSSSSSFAKRKGGGAVGKSPHSKKFKKSNEPPKQEGSSTQQKRALKHERQSHRRHADSVVEAKEIWNKLRLKSNSPEEVRRLMTELMKLIRGKMNEVALQHDASRVIQAAVQFGTTEERKEVVKELCQQSKNLPELCKVQYAHFIVLKIIKYCARDEESVRLVVKALRGSISKLAVHSVGARVVELLFSTFPAKATTVLKQEFYGPHFALFASDATDTSNPTLASNLEKAPGKKASTLEFVISILNKGLEKELFGFVYFQDLFAEYIVVASPNEIRSIAPSVVDYSIHMLSTRAGARVVAACASYGTAKDRKRIMKSLKGYARSSLLHRDAYLAILRLVEVTDDTVSVHKSVLAEILTIEEDSDDSPLLEIALNDTGSRLFLMLLVEDEESRQKYLDPYEREVLAPNPTVIEDGEEVPTSKKNPETRRKELIQYLRNGLIDMCVQHAESLLRSLPGSRVLREVYAVFGSQEMVDALIKVCVAEVSRSISQLEGDTEGQQTFLFEDPIGHLAVKNLLLCDADMQKQQSYMCKFATAFADAMQTHLAKIGSSNRGAFILTALLKVDATGEQVLRELKSNKGKFKKLAESGIKARAGFEALLKEL